MWPIGLILAAMFAIFAGIEVMTIVQMTSHSVDDVFDLTFLLFQGFWVLGWSVGVLVLGVLTFLFLFYRESARLQHGKLVHVPRLGPLNILLEYDLANVRNVRLEQVGNVDHVRIRFDYGEGHSGLGDTMRRADAERLVGILQNAATAAGLTSRVPETRTWEPPHQDLAPPPTEPLELTQPEPPPSVLSVSGLALIAANLLPLAGVMFFGWDLAEVIVLFWAFMAGHFLLIYAFFVRGFAATGPAPGVTEALVGIFNPLWTPLAGLFFSHGVSFFSNFIGRREYAVASMTTLMTAPYNRIIVMQLALIFGGWIIVLLRSPVPALALLVVLKTVMDVSAHTKEHRKPLSLQ